MNNKTKGVIAGIAGLALLGGGTTFALWSDSDTISGATITNGQLSVTATGSMSWQDVSDATAPVDITSIGDFRMVPGDTLKGSQGLDIALEGDNLTATLNVTQAQSAAELPTGVDVTYALVDGEGDEVASERLGESLTVELSGEHSGSYDVVVTVAFDENAEGSQELASQLENLVVSLG